MDSCIAQAPSSLRVTNIMTELAAFTLELAQQLHDSNQIIDFDWAWQVLGYSTKGNAKRMLVGYFERNFDYFVQLPEESSETLPHEIFITSDKNSNAGRRVEKIYLTVECFKEMGMLSKSEEGRQIRKYFLKCEALAKQSIKVIPQLQLQIELLQQNFEQLQSQVQTLLPISSDFIPPGWDAQVWNSLPSQDKRHFRYIFCRRSFRPSQQEKDGSLALPITTEQVRQQQRVEVERLIGETSLEEKERLESHKQKLLKQFWSENAAPATHNPTPNPQRLPKSHNRKACQDR